MFIRSALVLALATIFAAPLAAQGDHRGPGMGHGPMMMRGLDLTEAQKASLKTLGAARREAMKPKLEAAMTARKALHEAMMNPATPLDQLKALHEKASQAQFELALERRAMLQECLALLTPEQKAKAEKLRAERPQEGREGRMGRGEGHRHGAPPEGPAPEKK